MRTKWFKIRKFEEFSRKLRGFSSVWVVRTQLRMCFTPVPQASRAAAKAGCTFMITNIRKYGTVWPHLNGIDPLVSTQ